MTRSLALISALVGFTLGLCSFAADHLHKPVVKDDSHKLEIKTFRFRRHGSDFERLVIEFKRGGQRPKITATRQDKEELVDLGGSTLEGDIPEAAINDSYGAKAHWLGDLSFDADAPGSNISLRIGTRDPKVKVDAFWLNGPPRLVIDAFLPSSPRAGGLTAHANAAKKAKRRLASTPPTKADAYICFPAASRVTAKVMFAEHVREETSMRIAIDPTSSDSDWDQNEVACYPESERVEAKVTFGRSGKGTEPEPAPTSTPASPSSSAPAPSPVTTTPSPAPSNTQSQNEPASLPLFSSPLLAPSSLSTPAASSPPPPGVQALPPMPTNSTSTLFPDVSAGPSPASTASTVKPAEHEVAAPLPSTFKPPDMPPFGPEQKSSTLPGFDQLIPPPGLLGPSPAPTTPH